MSCQGVNGKTSIGWMLCQMLKAQGANIEWYDQLPNGVSADKPKTNEAAAAFIKSFTRRPGARSSRLPPGAIQPYSALQRCMSIQLYSTIQHTPHTTPLRSGGADSLVPVGDRAGLASTWAIRPSRVDLDSPSSLKPPRLVCIRAPHSRISAFRCFSS